MANTTGTTPTLTVRARRALRRRLTAAQPTTELTKRLAAARP